MCSRLFFWRREHRCKWRTALEELDAIDVDGIPKFTVGVNTDVRFINGNIMREKVAAIINPVLHDRDEHGQPLEADAATT